jgi:ribosomal protein L14
MILRKTWLKVSDSSQAKWLTVFALYGGSFRQATRSGLIVKGSIRVVQPFFCYYKGFSKKQIIKGRVSKSLVTTQSYPYIKHTFRFIVRSRVSSSVLVKKKLNIHAKHALGPAFMSNIKKKFNTIFKAVL